MALFISACEEPDPDPSEPAGRIKLVVEHLVGGDPLVKNEMAYTNAAGNQYLITEVKYFISDITLYPEKGAPLVISQWEDIFYIDDDIPSTLEQLIYDPIPAGDYDSVAFIFGITETRNQSFMYVNPPEVNMFWPEVLGGGYHYMMINGKWKDTTGETLPFNFHLGIGQLYKGDDYNVDSIYTYVQNYFTVSLENSSFLISENDTLNLKLTMNIESWFDSPFIYDHNYWGGDIMQKQPAMEMARENGRDVFSVQILY